MKFTRFWIVTTGTQHSTIGDIVFERDLQGLDHQFRGGLDPLSVVALYAGPNAREEATRHGEEILKACQVMKEAVAWRPEPESHLDQENDPPRFRHGGPRETCGICNPDPEAEDFAREITPEAKAEYDARMKLTPAEEGIAAARADARSDARANRYLRCPACNGSRKVTTPKAEGDLVFRCDTCGALFGIVLNPNLYVDVSRLHAGKSAGGEFYFDFFYGPDGGNSIHGWADEEGRMVQIG